MTLERNILRHKSKWGSIGQFGTTLHNDRQPTNKRHCFCETNKRHVDVSRHLATQNSTTTTAVDSNF